MTKITLSKLMAGSPVTRCSRQVSEQLRHTDKSRMREFKEAVRVLNEEIDTLKNQQAVLLKSTKSRRAIELVNRDYTLTMLMRAFAEYSRLRPEWWGSATDE